MLTLPVAGLLIAPEVHYYFQKDYIERLTKEKPQQDGDVLFLIMKEDKRPEEMTAEDFYPVGLMGTITEVESDGSISVQAKYRVDVEILGCEDGKWETACSLRPDIADMDMQSREQTFKEVQGALLQFVDSFQWGIVARNYVLRWKNLEEMCVALSYQLGLSDEEKYAILAADSLSERYRLMEKAVYEFIEVSRVSADAQKAQTESNEKLYREDALKKQIAILQKELDGMHPESVTDIRKFEMKIQDAGMNDTARGEAEKVLNRMKQEGENSHEYGMLYDYLDFVTGLSWKKEEFRTVDLDRAEEILEEDHYGLKKIKGRIIQQIASMELKQKQSGSILLFVGPPGTGKTSIGQSIARALDRKYVRISLGGIRDEAEIRGHRRTYIGAMPGRIMEGVKRSGVSNPVMVLDEVDKLAKAFDGDPSSALLEVLDPEQNSSFTDHYMNVPYDLSDVLFICTANTTDTIPEPLLNRMEVLNFQGYTETEKLQIAKKHLLPKAMDGAGLSEAQLEIPDGLLHKIIADYTMEAGVRGLKKCLDALCRTAAVRLVRGAEAPIIIQEEELKDVFDMHPIYHEKLQQPGVPGVVTGLAWTQAGGDILFIETMFTRGKGRDADHGPAGRRHEGVGPARRQPGEIPVPGRGGAV